MLLGIKDDEQDSLLSFLIEDTVNMIMAYCHIDVLPRQLESLVPKVAADMSQGERVTGTVKVRSSQRAEVRANVPSHMPKPTMTRIFSNYYKRLDPFRKRKGRVPSDISIQ